MAEHVLESIRIEGFKSIESVEVSLGRVNVLIGPNGSGKSNFVEVFSLLRAVREGRLREYAEAAGGADLLLHFGKKTTARIVCELVFTGARRFAVELGAAAGDSLYSVNDGGRHDAHPADWEVYRLQDADGLRKTARIDDNRRLRPDGSNLAAMLYLIEVAAPESYRAIVDTVRQATPFFDGFDLAPSALNMETIRLSWRHRRSDHHFGASSLSDGTLRFIAMATLLLQPDRFKSSIIVIDEPELGLHPTAIHLLAAMIRQASHASQIIVSTQSPLLLDNFEPDEVLVASQRGGATTFERLDGARLAKWLEEYSLGQLWEKNELGGTPVAG